MESRMITLEPFASDSVRDEVREHYAGRVRSVSSSYCGPDCCSSESQSERLYESEDLALVPEESANVSYGCGNPTAIAALRPGEVVLDLGSGGGIDVFLAAERVGATGFVYGVDMTDEMLDLARRNAARQGRTNVEFRKGFIESIPLDEKQVDVIISNCVVNLSPDKSQVLSEAFRVLKPGGRLAISDVVIDGDLSDLPVSEAQVRGALSWAGCIAGALTIDDLTARLVAQGFEDVTIEVKHRYSLDNLGVEEAQLGSIPADVAAELATRFVSANIQALRPVTAA